jgi:hypothetical protein
MNLCEYKFLCIAFSPNYFPHMSFSGHSKIQDSQVCLPAVIVIILALEVVESASWMLQLGKWISSFRQMDRGQEDQMKGYITKELHNLWRGIW